MSAVDKGLVILIPVLRRPHRVEPVVTSIGRATPNAHVLFVTDPDDEPEIDAVRRVARSTAILGPRVDWIHCAGNYAAKINAGAVITREPWLFMAADDLEFHPGWFEECLDVSHLGSVIGTNDLGNARVIAGEHSTHTLVHRSYVEQGTIDEPGQLLHEGYPHEFVDDEFVETAKARGVYVHAHDAIVEHLHPSWGKAPTDDLYDAQRQRMRVGRRIFQHRRRLWT